MPLTIGIMFTHLAQQKGSADTSNFDEACGMTLNFVKLNKPVCRNLLGNNPRSLLCMVSFPPGTRPNFKAFRGSVLTTPWVIVIITDST